MNTTITFSQLNTFFVFILPFVVAFIAGILRQDKLDSTRYAWINEFLFHAVLLGLALLQTILGGNLGGSSISNFIIAVGVSYGVLSTRFGSSMLQSIQSSTSIFKAPPTPPAQPQLPQIIINPEQIAAAVVGTLNLSHLAQLLKDELLASGKPIDQQPTQALQIVRDNTPPPSQGG